MKKNTLKLQYRKSGKNKEFTANLSLLFCLIFIVAYTILFPQKLSAQDNALATNTLAQDTFKMNKADMDYFKKEGAKLNLSAEELSLFKSATEEKINELQNCITIVGNKDKPDHDRDKAIKSALKLFIPNAVMEVSKLYPNSKTRVSSYGIDKYFARLKSLTYRQVNIRFYNLAYLSNFQKGNDGKYYATATIFQEFRGITFDGREYVDRTTKTITVVLSYEEDEFFKIKRWIVKLGDIKITETRS